MANVLSSILGAIDDVARRAAVGTIDLAEGAGRSIASAERRLTNRNPLRSAATATQRTLEEQRVVYRDNALFDLVNNPKSTAKFVTPDEAANVRKAGGNIFEVQGWGPTGKASAGYYDDGGRAFIAMDWADTAAFQTDIATNAPTRGGVFWDWLMGRNQRRLKPEAERAAAMSRLPNKITGRNAQKGSMSVMRQGEVVAEVPDTPDAVGTLGVQARKTSGFVYPTDETVIRSYQGSADVTSGGGAWAGDSSGQYINTTTNRLYRQGTMNAPVDPDIFFDDVSPGMVWGSRTAWGAAGLGLVGIGASIQSGRTQGQEEYETGELPSMFNIQGGSF